MLETDEGTVRKVAWPEIFPWLGIVRVFRLAISLRVLVLGAMGIILTLLGWWGLAKVFSGSEPTGTYYRRDQRRPLVDQDRRRRARNSPSWRHPSRRRPPSRPQAGPMLGAWKQLSRPVWLIFQRRVEVGRDAAGLLGAVRLMGDGGLGAFGRRHQPHRRGPIGGRRADRLGACPAIRRLEMALVSCRPAVAAARRRAGRHSRGRAGTAHAGRRAASCWPPWSGRWRCWPA